MSESKGLIKVKKEKITNHYKFVKEVYINIIQLGRGASGVCFKVINRDNI